MIQFLRQKEVRMTALAKVGLLFVSGLGIGLLVPLSRDRPAKFIPRPDENEAVQSPTLTVRCIVEQRCPGQAIEVPTDPASAPGVEVIVRPPLHRRLPMPEEVVVELHIGNKGAGNRLMPRTE
jgi:hypothetical protein